MQSDLWDRLAIRRDRRRRANKLLRRMRTADAAVVSAGKSGRTWLRAMVSHLYHRRHGLPEEELISFDNFHVRHAAIPRILFTGVASDDRAPHGRTWAEELCAVERIVFLTRDPRDVAVSFYFQMTRRATVRELQRKGVRSRDVLRQMKLIDFLLDQSLGIPRVTRFVHAWEDALAAHPRVLRVSYEELRADTIAAFGQVARFLDSQTCGAEITAAVEFGTFGAMQAREQQGFFTSERLRASGEGAEGRKVRRGKIGGYRDYLSVDEIRLVDQLVAGESVTAHGQPRAQPQLHEEMAASSPCPRQGDNAHDQPSARET